MKLPELKTNIPEYVHFLKMARTAQGLYLEDLAKKIGCSAMALSHWENGKRDIRFSFLEKWVDSLGFTLTLGTKDKKLG